MILSSLDLAKRLNHPRNSQRKLAGDRKPGNRTTEDLDRNDHPAGPDLYIRDSGQGRREGDLRKIPEEISVPVEILAKLGGNQVEIAKTFGVSDAFVSATKNDKVEHSEKAHDAIEKSLEIIRGTVVEKLDNALQGITPDKLSFTNAKASADIARSMASILKDISPQSKEGSSRVQVVVHSVTQKDSSHYDMIEVTS